MKRQIELAGEAARGGQCADTAIAANRRRAGSCLRRAVSLVAGLSALASLVLFALPDMHRSMTSLALLLPVFGCAAMIGILVTRRKVLRILMAVGAIFAFGPVAETFLPQPPGDLRVYSKNLLASNDETRPIVEDILATESDLVFLQEISPGNNAILDELAPDYPHQHVCMFDVVRGIAVLSRHPFGPGRACSDLRALAAAEIRIGNQTAWAVSAHVPWPWPAGSQENEHAAWRLLEDISGPVVLAGDFNSLPWTGRVEAMAALADARLAGPARETFRIGGVPISIDHAMAPGGGRVTARPYFGSDHAGILADLSLFTVGDPGVRQSSSLRPASSP